MNYKESKEYKVSIHFNFETKYEETHQTKIYNKKNWVSYWNPPINSCTFFSIKIKHTLNYKCIKSRLLSSSLNSNIRYSCKYRNDNNKTFCRWVTECKQGSIHSITTKNSFFFNIINCWIKIILCDQRNP